MHVMHMLLLYEKQIIYSKKLLKQLKVLFLDLTFICYKETAF